MAGYTLDYVVSVVMADIGETSTRYKQQFLNYAIQGFRRLNLAGMMPTNRTELLDINPNTMTAPLPLDYVSYNKVGLCVNGAFVNFTLNENICNNIQVPQSECEDCQTSIMTDMANVGCGCTSGMDTWWYYPYWYGGQWWDGTYGYGAGNYRGGFKVFEEQRVIAFDSYITADKVLLEYTSNGIAGAGTIIPEGAIGTLVAWVHFQRSLHSPDRTTRLDVLPYRQQFNAEFTGFRARFASMNLASWKELYYQTLRQTVKR